MGIPYVVTGEMASEEFKFEMFGAEEEFEVNNSATEAGPVMTFPDEVRCRYLHFNLR